MQPKRRSTIEPDPSPSLPRTPSAGVDEPADESARIYFDGDSVCVAESFHELIRRQAERFNAGTGGTLIVAGHASLVDEADAAVQLSMHRTEAVAVLLQRFGVQSHRIVRVSHGANAPLRDAADAGNRCVEIRLGPLAPRVTVWTQRSRKTAKS